MRPQILLSLVLLLGCSSSEDVAPVVDASLPLHDGWADGQQKDSQTSETAPPSETGAEVSKDSSSSDVAQQPEAGDATIDVPSEVAAEAGPVVPPVGTECEYAFFKSYYDKDNGAGLEALRDATFLHIVEQVETLQACGAKITLGGMLSLMIYEGGGAKVAFYNDKCSENSYDKSSTCWTNPKARYSYQYGLAPVHTSNFHPCADVGYASKMRARLQTAMTNAGFSLSDSTIASVTSEVHAFCPNATPTLVDYYIVTAHSAFDVPKNGTGNDLKNAGVYPFFTPRVVVDLFFSIVSGGGGACASLTSDNAAIAVFGGGDSSYKSESKQTTILSLWKKFQQSNCP